MNYQTIRDRSKAKTQGQLRQSEWIFQRHFASTAKTMYGVMISPSLSRTCGKPNRNACGDILHNDLCDDCKESGIAVFFENVRPPCDHGVRTQTCHTTKSRGSTQDVVQVIMRGMSCIMLKNDAMRMVLLFSVPKRA